jgi:hypothetical protein
MLSTPEMIIFNAINISKDWSQYQMKKMAEDKVTDEMTQRLYNQQKTRSLQGVETVFRNQLQDR